MTAEPPPFDQRPRPAAGSSAGCTARPRAHGIRKALGRQIAALIWLVIVSAGNSDALSATRGVAEADVASADRGPPTQTPPPCPGSADAPAGNAGCLAVSEGRLLVIEQRNGRWSIPGGARKSGEAARCTSHRETLEETGIAMHVGELLKIFDNGFHVFRCESIAGTSPQVRWHNLEVRRALWLLPDEIPDGRWRYPGQLCELLQLTEQLQAAAACQ